MNIGEILLRLALLAALGTAVLLGVGWRARRAPAATIVFGIHTALVCGAFALLASHFLAHRFEYAYVAEYSSRALSPMLTLSAAWAGQQGSILLWTALASVLGLALIRQPGTLTRPALLVVSLAQAALLSLLMIRSPFVHGATIPPDGHGLNPLLEDPWMVIHPPVLFLGYAGLLIPFALTIAALLRREFQEWLRMVWPWTLFVVLTLGIGIALGGVWAYKVLGWGGYWGWDPVENASLIPWLVAVALLHGLLIQRTTGALLRTNLTLGALGWVVVLGGTYLTRSGVLQDFSVHSFADSGLNTPLISILGISALIPAVLLFGAWRSIEARTMSATAMSREAALWLGMIVVLTLAALVTFGTAAPLITALFGKPAGVQPGFYQGISVPLGIALVILMGLSPALRWNHQSGLSWLTALWPGFAAMLLIGIPSVLAGLRDPGYVVLIAVAAIALGVNIAVSARLMRRGWMYGAGYVGHAGVAVMVLGMGLSTSLGKSQRLELPHGQTVQSLGYGLTYQGDEAVGRGGRALKIRVDGPNWRMDARPALIASTQNEGVMRKPAIDGRRELYLSPLEVREGHPVAESLTWMKRGQEVEIGGVRYTFRGFRMESQPEFRVVADLRLVRAEGTLDVSPAMAAGPTGSRAIPLEVPGLGSISLEHIDADGGRAALFLPGTVLTAASAIVELSTKPFINLVWIGIVLIFAGTSLAALRRAAEPAPRRAGQAIPAR